jgi:hypothetical protein
MTSTKQPEPDAMNNPASGEERANFNRVGSGLFSELAAIKRARGADADGKKLFCRLPPPLQSAWLDRLSGGTETGATGHAGTGRGQHAD